MKKGSLYGLTSGFLWGLASVIIGLVLGYQVLESMGDKGSLLTTLFNDTISFIMLFLLVLATGKIKQLKNVLFSKSGIIIVLASIFAAPIGMTGYILAIKYLNPSIAASMSAIYPLVGLLLAYLILNERMKKLGVIGLFVAVTAIVIMGLSNYSTIDNFLLGLLFVMLCIFGWGSEAVIIGYVLKEDVDSSVALTIRQMTSSVSYILFILPFIGYKNVVPIFNDLNILGLLFLGAIAGTVSYLFYYLAIDKIGASRAMALNVSYPAWAFILSIFILGDFSIINFLLSIVIIIGSIMSVDDITELLPFFQKKQSKYK